MLLSNSKSRHSSAHGFYRYFLRSRYRFMTPTVCSTPLFSSVILAPHDRVHTLTNSRVGGKLTQVINMNECLSVSERQPPNLEMHRVTSYSHSFYAPISGSNGHITYMYIVCNWPNDVRPITSGLYKIKWFACDLGQHLYITLALCAL